MSEWPEPSIVAAVYDLKRETERCGGCGLTADDAWHVLAEQYMCPTCEDRDRLHDELTKDRNTRRPGERTRFVYTQHRATSSAGLFTAEGSRYRAGQVDTADG